jgi:SAM-dependent methyltransferase
MEKIVNIDDMIRIYKDGGHYMLVRAMENFFGQDQDLMKWRKYFDNIGGFSQDPWYPMWDILIKELDIENFLDLGVHVGQFSILPALLSHRYQKEIAIHMVSPFNGTGDKYSGYEQKDYIKVFEDAVTDLMDCVAKHIFYPHVGLSQNTNIKNELAGMQFDMMYIDGSHDYEVVKQDIAFYVLQLLKPGGIVIFDDANFYIPYGRPPWERQGYRDVVRAVTEMMDGNSEFEFLFNLTHNKIFRRNK